MSIIIIIYLIGTIQLNRKCEVIYAPFLSKQNRKVTESALTTEITKTPRDDPLHTGRLEL
jgi:hypothetical protein